MNHHILAVQSALAKFFVAYIAAEELNGAGQVSWKTFPIAMNLRAKIIEDRYLVTTAQ
jgi:hypothetical protein